MSRALAPLALLLLTASAAHADELAALLEKGPLVRVETDDKGRFQQALAIADVDASADVVWAVLTDYERYDRVFPRIDEIEVERKPDHTLVAFELDTPLVSTKYTYRYTEDKAKRVLDVAQVKGDLKGTHFTWRVVPLGDGRCRVYYGGVVKNFSSLAERLEDDQQTMTVGINVVSLVQAVKSVKQASEGKNPAR